MQAQTRRIRGLAMRWLESGTGSPVVLLHGIPTSPALWRRVMPRLEARCLAWEMVGYGDSIPQGRGRHIAVSRQAEHLVDWLDALGLERVVLVGHDLGGGVAQIAAVRHPERCAGLVLVNSIAYDSWPIPAIQALQLVHPLVARLPDAVFRRMLEAMVRLGHDDRATGGESAAIHVRPYLEHGGAPAFVHQIRSLHTGDTLAVADALLRIEVPARIVWGAADPFQPLEYGERLAHDLRAPLRTVSGARHFVPEDHPEAVAEAVRQVLAEPAHAHAASG